MEVKNDFKARDLEEVEEKEEGEAKEEDGVAESIQGVTQPAGG
jgi:hypothetical protein